MNATIVIFVLILQSMKAKETIGNASIAVHGNHVNMIRRRKKNEMSILL